MTFRKANGILAHKGGHTSCRGCFFENIDSCPDCDEGIWVEEGSPWHTGIPTEENEDGYWVAIQLDRSTKIVYAHDWFVNGKWVQYDGRNNIDHVIAWMPTTPFEFCPVGGKRAKVKDAPMTNLQLAEWCAEGCGQWKHSPSNSGTVYHTYWVIEDKEDCFVEDNIVIRPWGTDEWIKPSLKIYQRDCILKRTGPAIIKEIPEMLEGGINLCGLGGSCNSTNEKPSRL